jgi:hypothetical protein
MNKDPAIERIIVVNELTEILCGKPCDICKFYGQRSKCMPVYTAEKIVDAGWRKASEVAREVAYDFQNRLRHIFLDMCDYNDYGTLNLLQIDSAIEALYDTFIAELKKKYTESEKDDGKV